MAERSFVIEIFLIDYRPTVCLTIIIYCGKILFSLSDIILSFKGKAREYMVMKRNHLLLFILLIVWLKGAYKMA